MARGKTLTNLLTMLRVECRSSRNEAHNVQVRDAQILALSNEQERLWEDYNWPHLRVTKQYPLAAGQRFYDFTADFDIDRIEEIAVKSNGRFDRLTPGICEADYFVHDSDLDVRSFPPQRWQIAAEEQVEIWPISDQNGRLADREAYLKVTGIRRLKPLIADTDRADLDDRLIVLYAAAVILAAAGSKDASLKLDMANKRYLKLKSGLSPSRTFSMFGAGRMAAPRGPMAPTYRRPSN